MKRSSKVQYITNLFNRFVTGSTNIFSFTCFFFQYPSIIMIKVFFEQFSSHNTFFHIPVGSSFAHGIHANTHIELFTLPLTVNFVSIRFNTIMSVSYVSIETFIQHFESYILVYLQYHPIINSICLHHFIVSLLLSGFLIYYVVL